MVHDSREKPQILRTETIARTRIFSIERMELRFSNGNIVQYERVRGSKNGAVLMVPMLDVDTVLLIREYAAGVDRYELALPKGLIEPGESPLEAANRELMEEVGYGAGRLTRLTSMTMSPGYMGQVTHVVLAEELYEQQRPGDEPEEIEVVPWRLSRMNDLLQREDCTEARTLAALFLVRERLTHGC